MSALEAKEKVVKTELKKKIKYLLESKIKLGGGGRDDTLFL